jgi:hypothetical protein
VRVDLSRKSYQSPLPIGNSLAGRWWLDNCWLRNE